MPEPNGGFVGGVLDGKIWIVGGTNWEGGEKRWLAHVHVFDPMRRQWTSESDLDTPVAYAVAGSAKRGAPIFDRVLNGRPFPPVRSANEGFGFAGGFTGAGGYPSQQWLTRPNQWSVTKGLPAAESRVLAAGGAIEDVLIMVGGTDDPASIAGFKKTAISLDRSGRIANLPDYPGKAFGTAASTVVGDSLFIFAGANWAGTGQDVVNTDEAHALSMTARSWRRLRPFPYPVRGLSAVTLSDNLIYLAGGYKNDGEGFTDAAFLYDIAKDTYTPSTPLPYKAMVGLLLCDGYLYCLGGEDKKQSRTDACFRISVSQITK
jgi:N-acetylneuraminic acid mutarotase